MSYDDSRKEIQDAQNELLDNDESMNDSPGVNTSHEPLKKELLEYELPPCEIPDDILSVQTFVLGALKRKHEKCLEQEMNCRKQQEERIWAEQPSYSNNSSKSLVGYRAILDQLVKRSEPALLYKVLLSLAHGEALGMIASQPRFHPQLLQNIFRMDSFKPPTIETQDSLHDDEYFTSFQMADAHLSLCLALVSANGTFSTPMLECLVRFFLPIGDYQNSSTVERSYRVHAAMNRLLKMLPGVDNGRSNLPSVLNEKFPYRGAKKEVIAHYVSELLRMLDYAPAPLMESIFQICMKKALALDVEIRIHDTGDVTVEKDEDDDAAFMMDEDQESNIKSDHAKRLSLREKEMADEMADKLDVIMTHLFHHIESKCTSPAKLMEIFGIAHRTFITLVLTTYKSKFVQFLIFYLCGRFHEITPLSTLDKYDIEPLDRYFASKLITVILDPRQGAVLRQISACYLASFVSRAAFVDVQTVCETLAALLQWAELYIFQQTQRRSSADHNVFYTVCQSAFYIMCFRGVEAWSHYSSVCQSFNEGDCSQQLHTMDIGAHRWEKIVCSETSLQLRPLYYCLESVRREFLRLATTLHLLPLSFLAQQQTHETRKLEIQIKRSESIQKSFNERRSKATMIMTPATIRLSKNKTALAGGVGGMGEGSNPLDSFFPFDPYLLRRSHKFVEKYYRSWDGSPYDNDLQLDAQDTQDNEVTTHGSVEEDASINTSESEDNSDRDENEEPEVEWDGNFNSVYECDNAFADTSMSIILTQGVLPLHGEVQKIYGIRKHSVASEGSW